MTRPPNLVRRQAILDYIDRCQKSFNIAPSLRDIGRVCDISSTSVVDYYLKLLVRDGKLIIQQMGHRRWYEVKE